MTEAFKQQIENETRQAVTELLAVAKLKKGDVFVIGCSSSEIVGGHIGKDSSLEAAQAVYAGAAPVLAQAGVYLAAQCCEHLNRAIILEAGRRRALRLRGGLRRAPAPRGRQLGHHLLADSFADPVAVEEIRADAGIDIGGTLIGMHLRRVAVPVRLQPEQDRRGEHSLRPHPPQADRRRARPLYRGGLSTMAEKTMTTKCGEAVLAIREQNGGQPPAEAGRDPAGRPRSAPPARPAPPRR